MTKFLTLAVAGLALVAGSAGASAQSPLEGHWKNGKMTIRIAPCGRSLCGTVVRASAKQQAKAERGSGTDLIGATVIRDIKSTGANAYKARVFLADRNSYASGTIRMTSPNKLAVKGCMYAVLCKSADWDRVR